MSISNSKIRKGKQNLNSILLDLEIQQDLLLIVILNLAEMDLYRRKELELEFVQARGLMRKFHP